MFLIILYRFYFIFILATTFYMNQMAVNCKRLTTESKFSCIHIYKFLNIHSNVLLFNVCVCHNNHRNKNIVLNFYCILSSASCSANIKCSMDLVALVWRHPKIIEETAITSVYIAYAFAYIIECKFSIASLHEGETERVAEWMNVSWYWVSVWVCFLWYADKPKLILVMSYEFTASSAFFYGMKMIAPCTDATFRFFTKTIVIRMCFSISIEIISVFITS